MGNHTVGVCVIKALIQKRTLIGIVAHPWDLEDGVKYESVYDFGIKNEIPTIRGTPKDQHVLDFLFKNKPDMIWVADYKFILPKKIIQIPKFGCVNLHPSLLPKYKGRASINWCILNGEKETGLTAHYIDEGVDTGPIIKQIKIQIASTDYISDVLNNLYPIYFKMTEIIIKNSNFSSIPQKKIFMKPYPRRKPEDGKIDWNSSEDKIINLIRAVSKPYPGAFFYYKGDKYILWDGKFKRKNKLSKKYSIGEIINQTEKCVEIKSRNGSIVSSKWDLIELNGSKDPSNTINFFSDLSQRYGINFRSVNWSSKVSQELRFKKLLQIGEIKNSSILDIGCGIGDMFEFVQQSYVNTQYHGIDITPRMIDLCLERYPKHKDKFKCTDILDLSSAKLKFDWVVASGIFYRLKENPFKKSIEIIDKMYSFSKKGLAFNSLSSWSEVQNEGEFYMDPIFLLSELKKKYKRLALHHDYHPSDFTIYIYK
tara:strand:- start:2614 stop:4059 length:1446 start_codon:yes stop_codon:yes gene_type:complete